MQVARRTDDSPFATLVRPRRVWAVASIHAEATRLRQLHRLLAKRFRPGDRLVYLGNVIGRGRALHETLTELLAFRRAVLALPYMFAGDVVVLRGAQEEMWQKLLQLQYATAPAEILGWMIEHGAAGTIEAYGSSVEAGWKATREGAVGVARWTALLSAAMNTAPGHRALLAGLKRAALTDRPAGRGRQLFVHAGVDPTRPLATQRDSLWWGSAGFGRLGEPFGEFGLVVRGFDPKHAGVDHGPHSLSLDAGAGYGGPLIAGCVDAEDAMVDLIEA